MARKQFGQHFLEPAWVEKVIRAIHPKPDELFIEIGPGRGALTRPLAAQAASVIAYEIDRDLATDLRAAEIPNLTVVDGDFLELSVSPQVPESPSPLDVRVAGNLPYNVAGPILFKLVEMYRAGFLFADATVMVQREVADRLIASPGTKEYGVLSILIGHNATVEMLLKLPPGAFRPAPKVQSALVRLLFHPPDPLVKDAATFEALVQAVFTRRRKTLANALLAYRGRKFALADRLPSPNSALAAAGLDGRRRPETLTVDEFARLADVYAG